MPANPVKISSNALIRDLRLEFKDTYKQSLKQNPLLETCMKRDIPSDKLEEMYHYFTSVPRAKRKERGNDVAREAFGDVTFSVRNFDWEHAIDWHRNDEDDDQTNGLVDWVRMGAKSFGLLDQRVFFQYLTSGADADLVASVPNAPDGAALFSALDGNSANRFGVTDGNLVTGTGVAAASTITADFFSALVRFLTFQDTKGALLNNPDLLRQGFVVVHGAANLEKFAEAFDSRFLLKTVTSPGNLAATVSNLIQDSKFNVELWPAGEISDNDWFIFSKASEVKPIFSQLRKPLTEHSEDESNSDRSRRTGYRAIQWEARKGFGIALPYGACKINN